MTDDFSAFLTALTENDVEYLVVGGFAVAHYGYPRPTGDIDVWVRRSPENAERIVTALRAFGFDAPGLAPALFLEPGRIIRMGLPPNRIEILTSISGVEFTDCWPARVAAAWSGVPLHVLSLADLKANERASGRAKDQADLDELP